MWKATAPRAYGVVSLIGKALVWIKTNLLNLLNKGVCFMNETNKKGITTELKCQLYFVEKGYNVYTPISPDTKIDLIAEVEKQLIRIQIKSCHLTQNQKGIKFNTSTTWLNSQMIVRKGYSKEDIDFFATVFNNEVYLIPVEICGKNDKILSFESTPYGPCYLLGDYKADKILEKFLSGYDFSLDNKDNRKKVAQYDLNNNFIQEFESFTEAAKSINKPYGYTHISAVAGGKRKTAYGYIWKLV